MRSSGRIGQAKALAGFSLLELLLVVGILAALAGVAYTSSTGRLSDSKVTAVDIEMENIRAALLRYKQDNFEFPSRESPVDVAFLYDQLASGATDWDHDYQKGWRGPYLQSGDSGLVDVGDDIQLTGIGDPHVVNDAPYKRVRAIPDPFAALPVNAGDQKPNLASICDDSPDANNNCLFDWRRLGQGDEDDPMKRRGRPYFLFELDGQRARIISLGPDGIYNNAEAVSTPLCPVTTASPEGDDIVLCLY